MSTSSPHPSLASARPRERRLKAARLVEPLYHGSGCEGLSGLYAAVNAVQVASEGRKLALNAREAEATIEAGLKFIALHDDLARCCAAGIRFPLWRRLIAAVAVSLQHRLGFSLVVEEPLRDVRGVAREQAFGVIEMLVVREKPTVLLRRGGRYSVVIGYTDASILLMDSGGHRWIARNSCCVPQDAQRCRHQLCPWSITTFEVF